jgi:hypothetical protein
LIATGKDGDLQGLPACAGSQVSSPRPKQSTLKPVAYIKGGRITFNTAELLPGEANKERAEKVK